MQLFLINRVNDLKPLKQKKSISAKLLKRSKKFDILRNKLLILLNNKGDEKWNEGVKIYKQKEREKKMDTKDYWIIWYKYFYPYHSKQKTEKSFLT